jgi:AcrR family transcriptional regulator
VTTPDGSGSSPQRPSRGGARAGAGRPRRPGVEAAVVSTTLDLLATRTYGELTVDAIADGAGVARTTIYRRWPSKAAVVAAAVGGLYLDHVDVPDTGSLRDDLVALLTESYRLMADGSGRVLERLIREAGENVELADLVRATFAARLRFYRTILDRATARGELSADVDQELLVDLLLGPLMFRLLVTGAPVVPDAARSVVDVVLGGVADRTRRARAARSRRG